MSQAPLSWASSANASHPSIAPSLPNEVIDCLQSTRFLHLATCAAEQPHVSLMNYTYLPETPFSPHPTIVMTTNRESRKTTNLAHNPNVSLLVHDWVSQRTGGAVERERSPSPVAPRTNLAALLSGLNTAALARISVTMSGRARILEGASEEGKYCLDQHVHNYLAQANADEVLDERALSGQDVQIVSVRIGGGRIADWKGGVQDFIIRGDGEGEHPQTNGV